jgi:lipopolysaccharide export system protein LptA
VKCTVRGARRWLGLVLLCAPLSAAGPGAAQGQADAAAKPAAKGRASAERFGLSLDSGAPLDIKAGSQKVRERPEGGRHSVWSGGVTLEQGNLSMGCQQLEVYFASDEKGGGVEKIQAQGKVRIRQGELEMHCERAVYDVDGCRATCERADACQPAGALAEPALLRQGKDTVTGGRIEFDVCTGDFQVSCGASGSFQPRQREAKDAKKSGSPAPAGQGGKGRTQQGGAGGAGAAAPPPSALQPGRSTQK